jgi:hypothetical protein
MNAIWMARGWKVASLIALLFVTALLSSCGWLIALFIVAQPGNGKPPETINFNSDTRILRGAWTAQVAKGTALESTASLSFTATYVSTEEYNIAGTYSVAGQPDLNLTGRVIGGDQVRFTPQMPAPITFCTVAATLKDANGQGVARLRLSGPYEKAEYRGWLEPITAPESDNCDRSGSYSSDIARVKLNRRP